MEGGSQRALAGRAARSGGECGPPQIAYGASWIMLRSPSSYVKRTSPSVGRSSRVAPPPSWRMAQPPSTVDVDQGLIQYHRSAALDGPKLELRKRCRLSVGLVLPGVYSKWIEAARDVDRADRIELVFQRPAQ